MEEKLTDSLSKFVHKWRTYIFNLEKKATLKDLCIAWYQLGEQYDALEEKFKELSAIYEYLNKEAIPKAFEAAGLDQIRVAELSRSFYPSPQYSASIVKDQDEVALKWLRDNKLGGIIKETVNRNTLAATLKGRLLEENLEPPDCMKLSKYTIIDSRKYTPKEK